MTDAGKSVISSVEWTAFYQQQGKHLVLIHEGLPYTVSEENVYCAHFALGQVTLSPVVKGFTYETKGEYPPNQDDEVMRAWFHQWAQGRKL